MTKSERQVMELLWAAERPLSCTEIVALSTNKTWKDSYVHSLIKSLIKKDMVKIDGFELISHSYVRKFAAALSKPQYYVRLIAGDEPDPERMNAVIQAYADMLYNPVDLDAAAVILKKRKRLLAKSG